MDLQCVPPYGTFRIYLRRILQESRAVDIVHTHSVRQLLDDFSLRLPPITTFIDRLCRSSRKKQGWRLDGRPSLAGGGRWDDLAL